MLITGLNDQGQKYPKPICRCNNSVFHAGEECPIHFEIDATIEIFYQFFHLWLWFRKFRKSFQLCVYFQFVANCTQESRATFLFSSVCKSATAEHFSLKMKNVFHLEAAASIQKANPYSVKKIWLCKQFQVYGYFCLKQKSFFWILLWNLRKWTLTGL